MALPVDTARPVDIVLEALSAVARDPSRVAHAMPAPFYTSPDFLEIEKEQIFRRQWICIGHAGEVAKPGDYFTTELVDEPLLVVRDKQGQVNVFSNVCRHRGNLVATGRGRKQVHACAYHAWSYGLDGRLVRAPLMDATTALDQANCRLPQLRSEVWQNFIFVNLDGRAPGLAPQLAPLTPHIRNYHNEERHLYYQREEVWQTNWKCLAENFMEGYHLSVTHPVTLHPVTPTELCEYVPGNGAFSAYKAHYTPDAPQREPHHADLTAAERRYSFLFSVFPGFVVTFMPHLTVYLALRPVAADQVAIRWGIAGHRPQIDAETLAAYVRFTDDFNAEDRVKLETLQRGLKSRFYEPGPLAPADFEGTIQDFYRFMAASILGP